ncbi:hypothetical protein Poli38472_010152 [Pythium oligandrum]|uniref:Arrestin C-terminal-like domain-containing protein n=1 Tax=Pythium oligandrum TaxID=41045 RepID=A0A8K1C8Y4_PYTOL|nr:hypothetical protein Poli38472_010152 [Pythium oligandrum]|eukprot:TMW58593.1 hypothetical protein Poli38472_010152 [Pythium oligandrum]
MWIDPATGSDTPCSVGHVIDFGFLRDGNVPLTPGVSLGDRFCLDPPEAASPPQAQVQPSDELDDADDADADLPLATQDTLVAFADLMDTLEAAADVAAAGSRRPPVVSPAPAAVPAPVTVTSQPPVASHTSKRLLDDLSTSDPSIGMRTITALAQYPDLLHHYVSTIGLRDDLSKRRRLTALSDSFPDSEVGERGEGNQGYRPTPSQQAIHQAITSAAYKACLDRTLRLEEAKIRLSRAKLLLDARVREPASVPSSITLRDGPKFLLDLETKRAVSQLLRRTKLSFEECIRAWRGQSEADPRPNKALRADHLEWLLHGYDQQEVVLSTIRFGVFHEFAPPTSAGCVFHNCKNHKSAGAMHNALVRSIREGQDTGTYLVLDFDAVSHWRGITPSPFGCVPKADADPSLEARVIHDLSFPRGASTNDASVQSDLPPLTYEHVRAIARRILCLKARDPRVEVLMMRGDVKSAFRHLFGHPSVIRRFAGVLQELRVLVLDLALPFGWTGSPAHYGAFGSAISFLVRRESPATLCPGDADDESFFCYEWVDDHVLVEQAKGDRLALCDIALRLAMVAVLGPRAINEKKFTSWSTQSRALGLDWDTTACTVSMPSDKVEKALGRVRALLAESTATQSSLSQLLGSLRHVSSCFRPAKPFFQRLATLHRQAYRFVTVEISTAARLDLLWFEHILQFGKLQGVPLRFFADLPDPDVHIFMDASDQGLCALDPARREFLRIEFDEEEQVLIRDNLLSINVREQLSAAFSVLVWGQRWRPATTNELTHVQVPAHIRKIYSANSSPFSNGPLRSPRDVRCVRLVVERPITTRGLIATLSGRERLYWEHKDNHGRHPHSMSLELLDEKVMLIDPKANGDDKVSLDCCTCEFNVEFQIPKKLPAMFEYKCRRIKCMERVRVYIEYLVTATLLVDGFLKANLECTIPIVIDSSVPPVELTGKRVTVIDDNEVKLFGFVKQGAVATTVSINSNVLDANATIFAIVNIDNSSKRELESLRLCLVEDICVNRHQKRFNRTRASYRDVCCRLFDKNTLDSMTSDSSSVYELQLPVTPNDIYQFGPLPPTMRSHFIVSLSYRVVLECKFHLSRRIKIDIPVTVAHSDAVIITA